MKPSPTYSLVVTVTDDGSPIAQGTANVTVTVNNLNEPPVVSPPTYNLAENSPVDAIVGTPVVSDPDTGQTLTLRDHLGQ